MIYPVVRELTAQGLPAAVCCRLLGVSTWFYEWRSRTPSARARADAQLTVSIQEIHRISRGTYGAPLVHAELRLGLDIRIGRKRVARLMRSCGLSGVYRRRTRGCTVRDPAADPHPDLVGRQFAADGPDRCGAWTSPSTAPARAGCTARSCWTLSPRRVVGWSIADHLRAELVCDALDMARWRRRPKAGQTVAHSDHGSQYTSWAFGQRLRTTGLLGSMGTIGDCFDNSMVESFFDTLQLELLDRQTRATRQELANAIFEYIEAWYNPYRRHSTIGMISPIQFEREHTTHATAARVTGTVRETGSSSDP